MNLSITPELQQLIKDKIASGRYANASEVVRDALRRMDERPATDPWQELRAFMAPRMAEVDRGETISTTMSDIIAEVKAER